MSDKPKLNANTLTQSEYVKLLAKMRAAKVSAVVLSGTTLVLSESGVISVLGENSTMTTAQQQLFKSWLIMEYGDK